MILLIQAVDIQPGVLRCVYSRSQSCFELGTLTKQLDGFILNMSYISESTAFEMVLPIAYSQHNLILYCEHFLFA